MLATPTVPLMTIGPLIDRPRGDGGDTGGLTGIERSHDAMERVEEPGGGGGGAESIRLAALAARQQTLYTT